MLQHPNNVNNSNKVMISNSAVIFIPFLSLFILTFLSALSQWGIVLPMVGIPLLA